MDDQVSTLNVLLDEAYDSAKRRLTKECGQINADFARWGALASPRRWNAFHLTHIRILTDFRAEIAHPLLEQVQNKAMTSEESADHLADRLETLVAHMRHDYEKRAEAGQAFDGPIPPFPDEDLSRIVQQGKRAFELGPPPELTPEKPATWPDY